MDCTTAREAISAALDGEAPGVAAAELAAHVEACPACRGWRDQVHLLTRRVRLQAAPRLEPPGRLVGDVLRVAATRRRRASPVAPARLGLVAAGVAQLAISVPALVLGHDHGAPVHVAHELGSLDAAVGLGFLAAAWRPSLAAGMRAVMGAAALLLVSTAILDLVAGRTGLGEEAWHLVVVVGCLLLWRAAAFVPPGAARRLGRRGTSTWPARLPGRRGPGADPLAAAGRAEAPSRRGAGRAAS